MDRKMAFRDADILMRDLVRENLLNDVNDLREMFFDTEEWLLLLTAASNSDPKKRFPMTPSDVSRIRKRLKISTIVESEEEDEAMPLPDIRPAETFEPVRRASRKAFKLASTKMKEPSLIHKLRRPGNTIPGKDDISQVHPPKQARKGKSNVPNANMTMVTPESSFASAGDSLTSDLCNGEKVDPMETEDDIVFKKVQSTRTSTYDDRTKKSSLQVKSVTVMRSSKRVTKQLIKTVVESPARCMAKRKSFTDSSECDSDSDIPIVNLVTNAKKPERKEHRTKEQPKISKFRASNGEKEPTLIAVNSQIPILLLHRLSAATEYSNGIHVTGSQQNVTIPNSKLAAAEKDNAKRKCGEEVAELRLTNCEISKSPVQMGPCEAAPAEDVNAPIVNAPVIQKQSETKINNFKTKAVSNETKHNSPEAIRSPVTRHFEPVSVKKRVAAIEQVQFVEPVAPAIPNLPVRMTRTKVREMMASLNAVASLPDKKTTRRIETSHLMKIARKSLMRANTISLAKERRKLESRTSVEKENTSPLPNGTKSCLSPRLRSTNKKNRTGEEENSDVHPSHLLAQMSASKQPLVNLNANISTFLPKTKVVSAAEKAEEKRKEERRQRRENNDDALLKKKALIQDRTEQRRKRREEKERNVLAQKALKEQEMAEMKMRIEKENIEKARLVQEREEILKKDILRKKEEAKLKAAKIEERRVRQEAERLQALKLQEEEQQKLLAQKKREQEDAERLQARRMLEEKEKKEKEAAQKEAVLKLEKQNQKMNVVPIRPLDATFEIEKPALIAASKDDYPLLDLSKGNDSDFSDAEEDVIPSWAKREALVKNLKSSSGISIKAMLCYFGSKPTTPDLNKIFTNTRVKHVRSSSAHWKSPPRCSMVPDILNCAQL